MNYIRNFFGGWDAQKNINNPQLNKVEKEVDGFVVIDSPINNEPETNYISKALNIRNISNNIISGIKKITSGVLDIVSCANPFNKEHVNNKTQQEAGMLLDKKSIQDLTEKVKLYFGIDDAYIRSKKGNKFAEEISRLKKENKKLQKENEKLKNRKSTLDSLKLSANFYLISKNNAKILYNYERLACAKASDDGSDKQQMQYLSQVNDVADKMIKKYENHLKKITSEISELKNLLEKRKNLEKKHNKLKEKRGLKQNTNRKNPNKKISGKKDASLRPNINAGTIKKESIENSNIWDDIDIDSIKNGRDEAKAENEKQNKLINEQKKELSKLRKEQDKVNNFFAQYGQNNVSDEELKNL